MSDREERDQPEGVRILGAEEAQAVLEGEGRDRGASRSSSGGDELLPRRDATWSASEQGEIPPDDDDGERADLPVFPRPMGAAETSAAPAHEPPAGPAEPRQAQG